MKIININALLVGAVLIGAAGCGPKRTETASNSGDTVKIDSSKYEKEAGLDESKTDKDFINDASDAGMQEIALGKLALKNGSSAATKQMAQMIITDHTKAADELTAMALKRNVNPPAELSHKGQDKVDRLSKKTGAEFDKEYASLMVSDHEEAISLFKKEGEKGDDSELKSWAVGVIPTLEHHLEMARSMKK